MSDVGGITLSAYKLRSPFQTTDSQSLKTLLSWLYKFSKACRTGADGGQWAKPKIDQFYPSLLVSLYPTDSDKLKHFT